MKYRHSAVLALVGWYLMLPPVNDDNKVIVDAPLWKWNQSAGFDSASECERILHAAVNTPMTPAEYQRVLTATRKAHRIPLSRSEMDIRAAAARCVSTDDPRLKEK
jgi:hypothetical protein